MLPEGWADYVLADVPCSGLGVLRSRPDARWRKQPEISAEIAPLAYAILQAAASRLRPGGVMLFPHVLLVSKKMRIIWRVFWRKTQILFQKALNLHHSFLMEPPLCRCCRSDMLWKDFFMPDCVV